MTVESEDIETVVEAMHPEHARRFKQLAAFIVIAMAVTSGISAYAVKNYQIGETAQQVQTIKRTVDGMSDLPRRVDNLEGGQRSLNDKIDRLSDQTAASKAGIDILLQDRGYAPTAVKKQR